MSVVVGYKQHLFAFDKTEIITFKHFLVFGENILESITFLFSKLKTGKIHLSKINFPINEFLKYFGNNGNFFCINIEITLHMHLTVYGIVLILSINV